MSYQSRLLQHLGFRASAILLAALPLLTAAAPYQEGPLAGAIVKGDAWAVRRNLNGVVAACHCLILSGKEHACTICSIVTCDPCRWHVQYGAFWVFYSDSIAGWNNMTHRTYRLHRYELNELRKGQVVAWPGAMETGLMPNPFNYAEPIKDTRILARMVDFSGGVYYYDAVPIGSAAVVQFVLTNVGGRLVPRGADGLTRGAVVDMTLQEEREPRWSLKSFEYRSRWDSKNQEWQEAPWRPTGQVEVGFREPFCAFARGPDYYFLTDSGRLFRAARPVKGTFRKMETTYAERDRPVAVFLTDADSGRVFLFRHASGGTGKPAVAELAPRLAWREYDPALYRPGSAGPSELRRVVGYARVLQALGLVPVAGQGAPGRK